jgi:hypothetical protein
MTIFCALIPTFAWRVRNPRVHALARRSDGLQMNILA